MGEYLVKLRTAEEPERQLIGQEFQEEVGSDLERLKRELRRAGLEALWSKEGAVALIVGVAMGAHQPGIGLAFGLAGGLLAYRQKRREAFDNHWSSWMFAPTQRLAFW